MEENGVWRTIGGRRIFIKDGEDLETAMKKSGKFDRYNDEKKEKIVKLERKKDELNEKLDNLDYEQLNEIYEKTQDFDTREIIMNKMQEKDVVRFGKEVMGLEMKDIQYKGTFDEALKKVNEINKDKEFKTEKVFHGTNAKFEKFDYDHFGQTDKGDFGQGIYMTKDKEVASRYGKDVKEVEIKYKNPLILNDKKDFEEHFLKYGDKYGEAKSLYNSKQTAISIMNMGYDAVIDNVYGQVIVYNLENTNIKK